MRETLSALKQCLERGLEKYQSQPSPASASVTEALNQSRSRQCPSGVGGAKNDQENQKPSKT